MTKPAEIIAYKGFEKDFTCRGHQYEVGQTYTTDSTIEICRNGFHACENPFDVLSYYDILDSRFAEVRLSGEISRDNDGSTKIAASSISITTELTLPEFIQRGIQWLLHATKGAEEDDSIGDNAKIASSGYHAKIASGGECAQIASSGYSAKIASSGYGAKIGSSGYGAKINSSGDYAQIGSSGHYAQIASSGYNAMIASGSECAQIGSSGDYAQIGSGGYNARIASSGYYARIASSGYSAQIGSIGDNAQIGSSGDSAQIASSGDNAKIASGGYRAQVEASGSDSVIASAGVATRAKGAIGTWIALAEFIDGKCVGFATGCIGQNGLKPDTWYKARGGKLVEVDD